MPRLAVIISPNWQDYAQKYLAECMESLRRQTRPADKIFLLDNATSEASFALLKKLAPEAEIIRLEHNAGFAEANNLAMKQALAEEFDYLVLLNMDTVCDREALAQLEQTAVDNPLAGSVQARLMLWEDQAKINSLGNATHYLGFGFCLGYKDNYQASLSSNKTVKKIFYASGAAVLFKAQTLRKIGLFDEVFWMYAEDQDLGWRIWLTGQECVLATEAVVFHKYEFTRSASRYYWIDRNRFLVILKNYRLATLILVLPALIVMEFGQLYFALTTGWFGEKMRVYQYLFKPASWRYIFRERKKIQALRQVKDREIRHLLVSTIEYQEIASWPLRVANVIFSLYWRIIKPLIIW